MRMANRMRACCVVVALLALALLAGATASHAPSAMAIKRSADENLLASGAVNGTDFQTNGAGSLRGEVSPRTRKQQQLLEFRAENAFKDDLALFWMPAEWRAAMPPFVQVRRTRPGIVHDGTCSGSRISDM